MPINFHGDMDKYLSGKRRKRLFSDIKSKIMNKKAVLSYRASNKLGNLKDKFTSKVGEIRNKSKSAEKEITRNEIDELVEKSKINEAGGQVTCIKKKEENVSEIIPKVISKVIENQNKSTQEEKTEILGSGWKEVKFEKLQRENTLDSLEEEKRKVQDSLNKIEGKREFEKQKLVKLGEEREQRERAESEEEKAKRLALEDEVRILKEKQKIESDRLSELKAARRIEQMDALRGRVTDILFKKKPKVKKDMGEVVRKEIRAEAKTNNIKEVNISSEINEVEKPEVESKEIGQPKEDVTKVDKPEEVKSEEISTDELKETLKKELKEELQKELKEKHKKKIEEIPKPKKKEKVSKKKKKFRNSFLSRFIQVRTTGQIAKEKEARLKQEEEQALKDQSNINNMFQSEEGVVSNKPPEEQNANIMSTLFSGGVKSNASEEGQGNNFSSLFPDDNSSEMKDKEGTIELDGDYKIKVVKN
jgi:hypothetical protein